MQKKIIIKIKDELKDKIELISEILSKLSHDSRLGQDELNKAYTILDDTLNFICNITNSKNINRDKHKDIDECVLKIRLDRLVLVYCLKDNKIIEIEDKLNIHTEIYIYKVWE